jgi:Sigma-70, region 4
MMGLHIRSGGGGRRASLDDLWRTWLVTGVRRQPGDRRRIRGAHAGLKRMLIEGMHVSGEKPYTWRDFSDAMVRQSVGEAMRSIPAADAELVKLAFFGGLSNRDIAQRARTTEAGVERRLRRALDFISEHVQHGRGLGAKLLGSVVACLGGRWLAGQVPQLAPAGLAVAALIAVSQPAPAGSGDQAPAHPSAPAARALGAPPPALAGSVPHGPAPAGMVLGRPDARLPSVGVAVPPVVEPPPVTLPPVAVKPPSVPGTVRPVAEVTLRVTGL